MAENVVRLKPDKRRIDLRGSNRFKDLLETYLEQSGIVADAMKLKKEADSEIRELIGDAEQVLADGYLVTISKYHVNEYVVKASDRRRMTIRVRKERR